MCRLMGFVSKTENSFPNIVGENFEQFTALSARHGDGWGISTCSQDGHSTLLVEPAQAKESALFSNATKNIQTDGALLHLRWATGTLSIKEGNTHPFTFNDFSFIHNGAVFPPESLDPFINPSYLSNQRGETDSERYFFLMMTEIGKLGVEAGVHSAVTTIRDHCVYSSINAMLLTPAELYVINEHNDSRIPKGESADYYDLFYTATDDDVLVASSGWDQPQWKAIANNTITKIDRKTLLITQKDLRIQREM